jgi:hypothetical protein
MASGSSRPPESAKMPQFGTEIAGPPAQATPGPGARPVEHGVAVQPPASSDRILFLDDDPDRARAFLGRHPEAVWVQTAGECIARLAESWDQVHLDHDLGGEIFVDSSRDDCGMEVVRWLCSQPREPPPCTWFFVHSHNADAADLMVRSLRQHGYQAVYRPFGIDVLAWFSAPTLDEPEQPPPAPIPLAPDPPGWWGRQFRRFRRTAPPRPNADRVAPPGHEPSCGSSNFGAE